MEEKRLLRAVQAACGIALTIFLAACAANRAATPAEAVWGLEWDAERAQTGDTVHLHARTRLADGTDVRATAHIYGEPGEDIGSGDDGGGWALSARAQGGALDFAWTVPPGIVREDVRTPGAYFVPRLAVTVHAEKEIVSPEIAVYGRIRIQLLRGGKPATGEPYSIKDDGGNTLAEGTADERGRVELDFVEIGAYTMHCARGGTAVMEQ